MRVATRSSASSQVAGWSSPSSPRRRGVVSRSGARSTWALVQPFWHRPPRLVGKSRPATVTGAPTARAPSSGAESVCAHWSAQYGQ